MAGVIHHISSTFDQEKTVNVKRYTLSTGDLQFSQEIASKPTAMYAKEVLGYSTPGFFEMKRKGLLLPPSNWWKRETTFSCDARTFEERYVPHNWRQVYSPHQAITMAVDHPVVVYMPNSLQLDNQIDPEQYIVSAASDCYSQGYDLLTALGESSETVNLVVKTAKRLMRLRRTLRDIAVDYFPGRSIAYHYSQAARRLKRSNVGRAGDKLSNLELELRYGYRPLVYDLQSLYKVMTKFQERVRTKGKAGHSVSWVDTVPEWCILDNGYLRIYKSSVSRYEVSGRAVVVADFSPSKWQLNFAVTAWELIPLSFVVDFVVNVGQWIEAQSLKALSTAWVASTGIRREADTQVTFRKEYYGSGWETSGALSTTYRTVDVITTRTPRSTIPSLPHTQLRMNVAKVADLAALLYGAFRR
jgi:hypothetical protein